ncbi:hypothetical protein K490DRAFT_12870, partial [Saccharata proteae CBS 121410]
MSVPENEVLKPRNRLVRDEDQWAEINLINADVRDATTGAPANLLHADPLQPVHITGNLRLERGQRHLLRGRTLPTPSTRLELSNVTKYAYGQCEDGEIVFWAAGDAGWFKISPSRAYKETYDGMVEAIEILYFLADVYKGWSKISAPARTTEGILKAFAKKYPRRYADKEAAANTFPDDYDAMLRKMMGKPARAPKGKSRATGSRSTESQTSGRTPENDASKKKPGKPAASTGSTTSNGLPKKDNNWWESKVIWEMMQISESQGLFQSDGISVEACAKIMVRKYEVDGEILAEDYIRAHSSNLVYMMTHKRKPASEFWTSQPVFTELSSTQLSPSALRKVSDLRVRRRRVPLPDPSPPPPHQFSDSSSEEDIHAIRRRANKGKSSVLRPKSNKFSGKGTTRSGKSYLRSSGEEDSDSDNPGVTSPSKRKTSPEAGDAGRRKKSASRSQMRPAGGATMSPPDSDDDEEDEKPPSFPLQFKEGRSNAAETPASKYTPRIVSESVASFEANSPGDVWRCSFDGCAHKVYGASGEEAQVLIQEHCDEHDERRKAQIDLVRLEEGRSQLPVSNLIKRIREMAE